MKRFILFLFLINTFPIAAQQSPWSTTLELGWNSRRDIGYGFRFNYTIPLEEGLALVISPLVERGVAETRLKRIINSDPNNTEPLMPWRTIRASERRVGLGLGLCQQLGKVYLGFSVRWVRRLNEGGVKVTWPTSSRGDEDPYVPVVRFGELFDPTPIIHDDSRMIITGHHNRSQAALEVGTTLNHRFDLSLCYRYDAFGKHRYLVTRERGQILPSLNPPRPYLLGVSRGHYVMIGLTARLGRIITDPPTPQNKF